MPQKKNAQPEHIIPVTETVGARIRAARTKQNISIDETAKTLRIKAAFLTAIEDGHHEGLPGMPYAIGFVRTYAEHLGLDGNEMVRLFKEESTGLALNAKLSMPEPVSSASMPSSGLIFAALLLLAAAYGGWQFLSPAPAEKDVVDVPPDNLVVMVTPIEENESDVAPVETAEEAPTETVEDIEGDTAPTDTPATEPESDDASKEPKADETLSDDAPAETDETETAEAVIETEEPITPATPKVYGEGNENARVAVQAIADTWVEIKAGESVLLTRVLKKGDIFRLPETDETPLLRTGNAGGLTVVVDGETVPALGGMGAVRENVVMAPDRLKAGTATRPVLPEIRDFSNSRD